MKPYTDQTRAELIANLEKLGHKFHFLVKMNEIQLRDFAIKNDNRPFSPKSDEPAPTATVNPVAVPTSKPVVKPAGSATTALLQAISDDLAPSIIQTVTETLQARFDAALDNRPRTLELTIHTPDGESKTVNVGLAHEKFAKILRIVLSKVPIYLFGPAGSGKTTVARQVAEAIAAKLGRPCQFHFLSFGPASQAHEVKGYLDAASKLCRTPFMEAWEFGGVILLDEFDAAPDVMVVLNAALANGHFVFPDGRSVPKHADCYILAAGNTIGKGATSEYTSRQRQDGATMDRFWYEPFTYDERLEMALGARPDWTAHVQKLRKALIALGASAPDLMISPRASIFGGQILTANPDMTFAELEDGLIWKGCESDDKARVMSKAR